MTGVQICDHNMALPFLAAFTALEAVYAGVEIAEALFATAEAAETAVNVVGGIENAVAIAQTVGEAAVATTQATAGVAAALAEAGIEGGAALVDAAGDEIAEAAWQRMLSAAESRAGALADAWDPMLALQRGLPLAVGWGYMSGVAARDSQHDASDETSPTTNMYLPGSAATGGSGKRGYAHQLVVDEQQWSLDNPGAAKAVYTLDDESAARGPKRARWNEDEGMAESSGGPSGKAAADFIDKVIATASGQPYQGRQFGYKQKGASQKHRATDSLLAALIAALGTVVTACAVLLRHTRASCACTTHGENDGIPAGTGGS